MTPTSLQTIIIDAIIILVLLLTSLALAAFGGLLVSSARRPQREAAAALQWPATPGKITAAEVGSDISTLGWFEILVGLLTFFDPTPVGHLGRRSSGYDSTRHPKVTYTYTVAGRPYAGNRICFKEISGEDGAEKAMQQYAPGTVVTVYYDPANPTKSVLDRTPPRQSCLLIFSIIMVLTTSCCCFSCTGSTLVYAVQNTMVYGPPR